jgi:hypothetical protein
VRGKEQYRANCADRPLGHNSEGLLPIGFRNDIVECCGRDVLLDKERCGVVP